MAVKGLYYYEDGSYTHSYDYYENDVYCCQYPSGDGLVLTRENSYYCYPNGYAVILFYPGRTKTAEDFDKAAFLGEEDNEQIVNCTLNEGFVTVETTIPASEDEDFGYRYFYELESDTLLLKSCRANRVYEEGRETPFIETKTVEYDAERPLGVQNCFDLEQTYSSLKDGEFRTITFHIKDSEQVLKLRKGDAFLIWSSGQGYSYYVNEECTDLYKGGDPDADLELWVVETPVDPADPGTEI